MNNGYCTHGVECYSCEIKRLKTQPVVVNLLREIAHAKSIGEYEYAADLQFIVNFETKQLDSRSHDLMTDENIKTLDEVANWFGISLGAFRE